MKAKRSSILILLLLCIVVWGMIGWKVYVGLQEPPITLPLRKKNGKVEKKEIGLLLNYRDPFLDNSGKAVEASGKSEKVIQYSIKSDRIYREEVLPDFQYKGIIRMGKSFQAIVSREGEDVLLKCGDRINEFIVRNIMEESIVVECKGKRHKIHIE